MTAGTLETALAASGINARVEARERLAIVIAGAEPDARALASRRGEVIALAVANGFTHVALEVGAAGSEAVAEERHETFPGD